VQTANRYLSLYPGSPDAPYAEYLVGASYFKQIPDVTRDQQQTRKALEALLADRTAWKTVEAPMRREAGHADLPAAAAAVAFGPDAS
jgi:hypothetical protein